MSQKKYFGQKLPQVGKRHKFIDAKSAVNPKQERKPQVGSQLVESQGEVEALKQPEESGPCSRDSARCSMLADCTPRLQGRGGGTAPPTRGGELAAPVGIFQKEEGRAKAFTEKQETSCCCQQI